MAITYTWKIDMMHTQSKMGVENAVTEIHWSKTGTDATGSTGRYPGCTKFNLEEIAALSASGNFTPLNSLTEAQVLNWIQATITDEDMAFIDIQIQASIDQGKVPKTSTSIDSNSFPWAATN
jgi:hypothetical protein